MTHKIVTDADEPSHQIDSTLVQEHQNQTAQKARSNIHIEFKVPVYMQTTTSDADDLQTQIVEATEMRYENPKSEQIDNLASEKSLSNNIGKNSQKIREYLQDLKQEESNQLVSLDGDSILDVRVIGADGNLLNGSQSQSIGLVSALNVLELSTSSCNHEDVKSRR